MTRRPEDRPEGYEPSTFENTAAAGSVLPEVSARRTSWTAADLLAAVLPEPRYAVNGLLPEGLTFMCGAPKLGKSWLGLALGIAVAAGGHALGKIEVEQGETLYLALEDNERRLQSRLRLLLKGEGAPTGLYLETAWPRLDDGGVAKLTGWLDSHPSARLIVVDVYPRIRPNTRDRSSNLFQIDYDAASLLQTLAIGYGVAVVCIYHTRKADSSDFVETVSGTFGTAAAADTIMVLKRARGEPDATLHVTGRDVAEQELALRFASAVGTWVLLGDASEYGLGKTRKAILATVEAHGALTPKGVSDLLEDVSHDLAKKTMQRMFTDGQLSADGGTYSVCTPVSRVSLSPNEEDSDSSPVSPSPNERQGDIGLEGSSPEPDSVSGVYRRPVWNPEINDYDFVEET